MPFPQLFCPRAFNRWQFQQLKTLSIIAGHFYSFNYNIPEPKKHRNLLLINVRCEVIISKKDETMIYKNNYSIIHVCNDFLWNPNINQEEKARHKQISGFVIVVVFLRLFWWPTDNGWTCTKIGRQRKWYHSGWMEKTSRGEEEE